MSDFWERRKAAVRAEEAAERRAGIAAGEAEERARLEKKSDEEILSELELPDPDSMVEGDDFSAFLKTAVPERLRIRALRRLWTTNPVLANLDGLLEYGEDFTDAATVLENLQTAYRVGEGMSRHVAAMAEQASDEADEAEILGDESEESEIEEAPTGPESEEKPDSFDRNKAGPSSGNSVVNPLLSSDSDEIFISKPRRMSYRYDDEILERITEAKTS